MYPFIKVRETTRKKFFIIMLTILYILTIFWWILTGLQTQISSLVIEMNTENVLQDSSKIKVEHINEEGTLYLEDTSSVEDSQVTEYITVKKDIGTYYIPENKMTREISSSEAWGIGRNFLVLTGVIYVMCILLLINIKGNKLYSILTLILFFIISIFSMVVLEYFASNIIVSDIPIQEIIAVVFIVYCVAAILLRAFRKRLWGVS